MSGVPVFAGTAALLASMSGPGLIPATGFTLTALARPGRKVRAPAFQARTPSPAMTLAACPSTPPLKLVPGLPGESGALPAVTTGVLHRLVFLVGIPSKASPALVCEFLFRFGFWPMSGSLRERGLFVARAFDCRATGVLRKVALGREASFPDLPPLDLQHQITPPARVSTGDFSLEPP